MKQLKNVFRILTLLFTALFIASCDGNGGDDKDSGTSGDSIVCTYYMKDDTSVYYVFYGDKTAEYHANGKIANTRSELIYSGDPLKAGTVSLKISSTGTELISFNVKESNGTLIPTVELVPGFPVEYTLTLDGENDNGENSGTETPEEPSTDIDESPLMFMGFDNVVTIKNGTDITGITNTIYSLTSDTTLKFKGGINSITLTTIAAAISTNDSVKIALDFSEATGITEWTNKLAGQKTLYAISLPGTVTSVQDGAFKDCTNLKAITVPKTITEFPSVDSEIIVTFATLKDWLDCHAVIPNDQKLYINGSELNGEVNIPSSVTTIKDNAFKDCSLITHITIPDGITSIGENAFYGCGELIVNLQGSFSSINNDTFSGCTVTDVIIGNEVTKIPNRAFSNCSWLTHITIGDSVTEIGWQAFYECTGLTNIEIPKNVTTGYDETFYGCTNLSTIYYYGTLENWISGFYGISNIMYSLGDKTDVIFMQIECNKISEIKSVVIPNTCEIIAPYAFYRWKKLSSVTIPNGVRIIGDHAFSECSSLTSLTLPDSLERIFSHAFSKTGLTSINMPKSVDICDYAFSECSALTSIILPEGRHFVGNYAFYKSGLTSINIPDGYSAIGSDAFKECSSLEKVTIPNTVTSIYHQSFFDCDSLTNIVIPTSVKEIFDKAFYNCDNLSTIYYRGTEEQWNAILFYNDQNRLENSTIAIPSNITIVYNYTGD